MLQLRVYCYLRAKIQGVRPESMYVVTQGNDIAPVPYRIDGYATHFRLLERSIGGFVREPGEENA